ncbi:hypothetical protein ONS96_012746 [Cadophora gregata f. sp. sojae]|nr:hypothetical protein ONS96_012746 [Cadophora gregata f. sp. sojae]
MSTSIDLGEAAARSETRYLGSFYSHMSGEHFGTFIDPSLNRQRHNRWQRRTFTEMRAYFPPQDTRIDIEIHHHSLQSAPDDRNSTQSSASLYQAGMRPVGVDWPMISLAPAFQDPSVCA